MLDQGIKALAALAVNAAAPKVMYEDDVQIVVHVGDTRDTILKTKKPRQHEVHDLVSLVELANRFKADGAYPVVWYSSDQISLVIDDNEMRINRADLALTYSDLFLVVQRLHDNRPTFKHRPFVKMLRTELYPALPSSILLDYISKLTFESGSIVVGSHKKGEESMGKTLHAKVSKAEEIPNSVMLEFPVYNTRGLQQQFTLRCLVEIDAFDESFQLLPAPDGLEGVMHQAMDMIETELTGGLTEGIPLYHGKP